MLIGDPSSHKLPPNIVVNMLKDNGIKKVKLFDADSDSFNALARSGMEAMVGIPNDLIDRMSDDYGKSQRLSQKACYQTS